MKKVIVSKNKDIVDAIRQKLAENGGYCPCRLLQNDDNKCICKEFRDAIESGKTGKCHCGLYEIVDVEG